ncbi:daptide-type RiPP biosynthesis aminotransferase [Georgenia sunbinii]|uniref:daptide-type RiPP biosynthesis aminotransferase n=1 Tax=Georgenia sunbinii TaxID=3117728 RepID=UPI002F2637B3
MRDRSALWPALLPPSQHGRADLRAVAAHGTRISFADGTTRLCGTSGLWNVNLGYGDPVVAEAVSEAVRDASYLSTFRYENDYARRAADELVALCGADRYHRVLFSTSGGAANDLVMKLARQYQLIAGRGNARLVVGLRGSFHGLTFGAHALTGEDLGQAAYGIDQRLVRHVPPNDTEALRTLLGRAGEAIAAVVVEPVLGTGAIPLERTYVEELLRLRDEHGFLLVADEVATGFGRTGVPFASGGWPAAPDILVLSKALTNGAAAASAVLLGPRVADAFVAADLTPAHAETQAGTPPSMAAISAVIARVQELDLFTSARRLSAHLDLGLRRLTGQPWVADVTGAGCFRGIQIHTDDGELLPAERIGEVVRSIAVAGAVVHPGLHGIQLVPPLVATEAEIDELLDCVVTGVEMYLKGSGVAVTAS